MTALTEVQHAAITAAWLEDRSWQVAAAGLGVAGIGDRGPAAAVRAFYLLVARRGGWWHAVYFRTCATCAIQFTTRHPDDLHAACAQTRANARRRAARASGPHPTSTEAVRRWRQQNPGRELGLRLRERFNDPHEKRPRTIAQKAAHSSAAIRSKQRIDDELRQIADAHGAEWSTDEDRIIMERQDWSATALGLELGRTASSVQTRRWLLRKRGLLPRRGTEPIEFVAGAARPPVEFRTK